ncbi:Aldo/keto reductase [Peniophora sp. CONT]|nr:Aldo/keto reductase [Peniophora sp. CONT]
MVEVPQVTRNTGATIPLVGLGCWMGVPGGDQRVYLMCMKAIAAGYRHIDTAAGYANEEHVGQAIRDEFFVTTKLANTAHHEVSEALDISLSKLGLDYVDLYLIHWPQASVDSKALGPDDHPTINDTWADMEKVHADGRAKAIGVSNFSIKTLETLSETWKVVPAVNQVEMHPYLPWDDLKGYCDGKGIHLTAYSPIGRPSSGSKAPPLLRNDLVVKLAEKYSATPSQIVLSWGVQRGTSVIPKSENEERLRQNISLVLLDDADIKAINELHTQLGLHRSLLTYHKEGGLFGWTYEQLGWPFNGEGVVLKA